MKNYWLDRIKAKQQDEAKKKGKDEKYIYPRELWHYVAKVLGKRRGRGP